MSDHAPDQRMEDHVSLEMQADAAEGLLTPDEQARVAAHLRDCADCRRVSEQLAEITAAVRDLPPVPMPDSVRGQLSEILRAESQRRASGLAVVEGEAGFAAAAKRTDLGSFRHNPLLGKSSPPRQEHLVGRKRRRTEP